LALFATIYKSVMYALRTLHTRNKEESYDTFLAGLIGGYTVFGRGIQSSVNQQIVIYVFARVMLALAKMSVSGPGQGGLKGLVPEDLRGKVTRNAWPVFASLSWAMVMWIFRWHPETVQPSLRSSMKYMYGFHPIHAVSNTKAKTHD
jgi:Tim17/Tim22/Tim23/Pmp24 family